MNFWANYYPLIKVRDEIWVRYPRAYHKHANHLVSSDICFSQYANRARKLRGSSHLLVCYSCQLENIKNTTFFLSGAQHSYRQFPAIGRISQRSLSSSSQNAYYKFNNFSPPHHSFHDMHRSSRCPSWSKSHATRRMLDRSQKSSIRHQRQHCRPKEWAISNHYHTENPLRKYHWRWQFPNRQIQACHNCKPGNHDPSKQSKDCPTGECCNCRTCHSESTFLPI